MSYKRLRKRKFTRKTLSYCLVINGRTMTCFASESTARAEAKFFRRQHARRGFDSTIEVLHVKKKRARAKKGAAVTAPRRRRLYG